MTKYLWTRETTHEVILNSESRITTTTCNNREKSHQDDVGKKEVDVTECDCIPTKFKPTRNSRVVLEVRLMFFLYGEMGLAMGQGGLSARWYCFVSWSGCGIRECVHFVKIQASYFDLYTFRYVFYPSRKFTLKKEKYWYIKLSVPRVQVINSETTLHMHIY